MLLLDKIVRIANRKEMILKSLRQSELPLILYGAGSYALDIIKFLKKNNIKIDMACVDTEYIQSGECSIMNGEVKITTIENICSRYSTFNIIIGFSDYKKAKTQMENISGVAEVFFIDAPDSLDFFGYQYIVEHLEEFDYTYNLLDDQLSKDTFIAYINTKISGQPDGLYNLVVGNQYFPDFVTLGLNEVFIDCGAYDGDTIHQFVKRTCGRYDKIYAFEPDERNYSKLNQTIKKNGIKRTQTYKMGCWHSKTILRFSPNANMRSLVSNNGASSINVDAIDNVVDYENVTFIKMDIEGSELSALHGAKKTIETSKPKLAICVYHKPEDLITIPQYINSIVPNYKIYLRHHKFISWDTVLYAIPI
jgi:FkbM family methyltransferase